MNKKELTLAAQLLDEASDSYANNICNDFVFPNDWTKEDKAHFIKEYHDYNGDPEVFDENFLHLPDYAVMSFWLKKSGATIL